jgi:hypothetical protein
MGVFVSGPNAVCVRTWSLVGRTRWSGAVSRYRALVVDKSRRSAVRKKQQELLGLLNEWDPIGVMPGAPSDEYDCLLGLLGRLQRGDEPGKLSRYAD